MHFRVLDSWRGIAALLVAVASVSYRLFEKPDPELFAAFARWRDERFRMISSYFS
jgi:peptidoglycan/LPS O-acetylase OafA/YrhL